MQKQGRCSFWQLRRYGSEHFPAHSLSSYFTNPALSGESKYHCCYSCVQQARQGTLVRVISAFVLDQSFRLCAAVAGLEGQQATVNLDYICNSEMGR